MKNIISLKLLRETAGLNQTEVARRARISQTQLSLAENNLCTLATLAERKIRTAIVQIALERLEALLESDPPQLVMHESLYRALNESRMPNKRLLKRSATA